jgi:hypothetical protein
MCPYMYSNEEQLDIAQRIGVTQEVYDLLREEKRRLAKIGQKQSMAKIVCNLVLEKYALNQNKPHRKVRSRAKENIPE